LLIYLLISRGKGFLGNKICLGQLRGQGAEGEGVYSEEMVIVDSIAVDSFGSGLDWNDWRGARWEWSFSDSVRSQVFVYLFTLVEM